MREGMMGNVYLGDKTGLNEEERNRLYREATAMMGKVVWIPSASGKYELGRMVSAPLKDKIPGQTEDLVLVQPFVKDGFEEDENKPPKRIRVKEFLSLQSDCKNNHPDLYYKKYNTEERKTAEWLDLILKSKYKGDPLNIRLVVDGKDVFSNIYDIVEDGKKIRVTFNVGSDNLGEPEKRSRAKMTTKIFPVEMVQQWFSGDDDIKASAKDVEDVLPGSAGFGRKLSTDRPTMALPNPHGNEDGFSKAA